MAKRPSRKLLGQPRSLWEANLDAEQPPERAQAGEIEPGDEAAGGGDKGMDAQTGDGGYGGDAAIEGHDHAMTESERPVDAEIHGDPRTPEGENYPSDLKVAHEGQGPIGSASLDEEPDE